MFSNQQTFLRGFEGYASIIKQLTQLWKCYKEFKKNCLSKCILKLGVFMNSISGTCNKITDRNNFFICAFVFRN